MGRKSSLSDKQWAEIGKRLLIGAESARALAREFGTSEASVRRKFPAQRKDVKTVANQIVAAERAFNALPISSQIDAHNLANDLRSISMHLAGAAKYGSATAHRLAGIANGKVQEIDDAAPLNDESLSALKGIAVLTSLANNSAEIGLGLLKANKEAIDDLNKKDKGPPGAITYEIIR